MRAEVNETPATRTVAIRYPRGETEYWFTDKSFVQGDTLARNGRTWVVEHVSTAPQSGGKPLVTLAEITGAA